MPMMSPLEDTVRSWYTEGRSQRLIARDLNVDRQKIKQMIDHEVA
jgi:DNA-binding transcriptional regulator LsrR (DeoR family)